MLFVYEQAVVIERPVGGASTVTEVALEDVPPLLADRFGIARALGKDGRLELAERANDRRDGDGIRIGGAAVQRSGQVVSSASAGRAMM